MTISYTSKVTRSSGHHGSDGRVRPERWWDSPDIPTAHPSLEVVDSLLDQISEDRPGGKQSCTLASQLNALVVRGGLDPDDALTIQNELATNEEYAYLWRPLDGTDYLAWNSDPLSLAFVINQIIGRKVGVKEISADNVSDHAAERLRSGYAVVLLGQSAVAGHARLAFEPEGYSQPFVHDPRYPETTGFYDYGQLPDFQVGNRVIVF